MTDRKQNRVRIDAIINAIERGEYDDKLPNLQAAIDQRLAHKKQEVLALVQEVYGEGYTVSTTRQIPGFGGQQTLPLIQSSGGGVSEAPVADALGVDPEVDGAEFESRSPIIG